VGEPARLTALRRVRPGVVALEVEGRPWRQVPDDVVARLGLAAGTALERPLLRALRAELRRADALARAGRTLARRDLSRAALRERLRGAGVAPADAGEAVHVFERAGLLDDERAARARAAALAERGWGDAAIVERLGVEGFAEGLAGGAVAGLEAEVARASGLTGGEGDRRRAAARLARRGFSEDTIEAVVGPLDVDG